MRKKSKNRAPNFQLNNIHLSLILIKYKVIIFLFPIYLWVGEHIRPILVIVIVIFYLCYWIFCYYPSFYTFIPNFKSTHHVARFCLDLLGLGCWICFKIFIVNIFNIFQKFNKNSAKIRVNLATTFKKTSRNG